MTTLTIRTVAIANNNYVAWSPEYNDKNTGVQGASPDEAVGGLIREIWLGSDSPLHPEFVQSILWYSPLAQLPGPSSLVGPWDFTLAAPLSYGPNGSPNSGSRLVHRVIIFLDIQSPFNRVESLENFGDPLRLNRRLKRL